MKGKGTINAPTEYEKFDANEKKRCFSCANSEFYITQTLYFVTQCLVMNRGFADKGIEYNKRRHREFQGKIIFPLPALIIRLIILRR